MSTIKSSNEHLTFNADGSAKEIRFQANGTQKASISSAVPKPQNPMRRLERIVRKKESFKQIYLLKYNQFFLSMKELSIYYLVLKSVIGGCICCLILCILYVMIVNQRSVRGVSFSLFISRGQCFPCGLFYRHGHPYQGVRPKFRQ